MKKLRFTKKALSVLPVPAKGYAEYADTEEKALKLLITQNGTKTFYFRQQYTGSDPSLFFRKQY